MSDSKKSGKGKSIVIAILIIVLLTSPILIIYGITSTVENFIKGIVGTVVNAGTAVLDWFKDIFGKSRIIAGMYIYPLESDSVTQLKQQLEAQGIRTDEAVITEVMLRKMILAQAVTSFTQDTLCVAQVEQSEILQDTGYTDLNEYLKTLNKKNSKDEWPIDKYNYELYYVTDKFFYFKDKDDMMENGTDKYYLGLIGSIEIKTSEGSTLEYVSNEQFELAKTNFDALNDADKANVNNEKRKELLHKYTIDDTNGQMVVHKIIKNTEKYKYTFTNSNTNTRIEEEMDEVGVNQETQEVGKDIPKYHVITVPLDIQGSIDTSKYTLSIELLINLLNISSSPEFVDEFIDYALEESKITITAYLVQDEEISYKKDTYKIKDNFTYELYDMVNGADQAKDNMETYKSLIFDRIYEGKSFEGSVVNIPGFKDIDYDTRDLGLTIGRAEKHVGYKKEEAEFLGAVLEKAGVSERKTEEELNALTEEERNKYEQDYINEQKNKIGVWVDSWYEDYGQWTRPKIKNNFIDFIISGGVIRKVNPISNYLLAAYDPAGISLGDVLGEEITINERAETSWRFYISSMSTWYGNITYNNPTINTEYYIDAIDSTQSEYDSFNENSLTKYEPIDGEETKTNIYIYKDRAEEVGITSEDSNVTIINSADIFDNVLKEDSGKGKETNFENWLVRGLGEISTKDSGAYNTKTGAGSGSEYLYSEYIKTDKKEYEKVTKLKKDSIEMSTNLPQVDMSKVYDFLALWKNETGTIGNTVYKSDGIKVKYKDIYGLETEVADLFVSAPELLFDLLEQYDSTRELVDVFKYIMYTYTGIDHGISSELQMSFIFGANMYNGSDYIVNSAMSSEELVLKKEQLEEAINKTYTGEVKQNLLDCVDDLIYIQETNRVNAVFAIAVAIQETAGGMDWSIIHSSTCNLYGVKGNYNGNSVNGMRQYTSFKEATRDFGNHIQNEANCFKEGNYTVTSISTAYANENWGADIISEMTKIYNSIGISGATGGTEGKIGNVTTFTVGNRTYKNYKQIEESYKSITLAKYPNSTLYSAGCGITSDAIIATGFGKDVNPVTVNSLGRNDHPGIVSYYTGMNCVWVDSNIKQGVIAQLRQGYPVMVRVEGDGGFFRSNGHFFVILSISEDGNSIYVSDPGSKKDSRNGWMKTSILDASGYVRYLKMEAK